MTSNFYLEKYLHFIGFVDIYLVGTIYQPLRSGRIWHKVNF